MTLVAGGVILAGAILAAAGLVGIRRARRSVRHDDFDRALRRLLEEEAGKSR